MGVYVSKNLNGALCVSDMEQDLISRASRTKATNTANLPGVIDIYIYVSKLKPSASIFYITLIYAGFVHSVAFERSVDTRPGRDADSVPLRRWSRREVTVLVKVTVKRFLAVGPCEIGISQRERVSPKGETR